MQVLKNPIKLLLSFLGTYWESFHWENCLQNCFHSSVELPMLSKEASELAKAQKCCIPPSNSPVAHQIQQLV